MKKINFSVFKNFKISLSTLLAIAISITSLLLIPVFDILLLPKLLLNFTREYSYCARDLGVLIAILSCAIYGILLGAKLPQSFRKIFIISCIFAITTASIPFLPKISFAQEKLDDIAWYAAMVGIFSMFYMATFSKRNNSKPLLFFIIFLFLIPYAICLYISIVAVKDSCPDDGNNYKPAKDSRTKILESGFICHAINIKMGAMGSDTNHIVLANKLKFLPFLEKQVFVMNRGLGEYQDLDKVCLEAEQEYLNQHWFLSLSDAKLKLDSWRDDYNRNRPIVQ